MKSTKAAALRATLVNMRSSLVERLAVRFDGGNLALLGTVESALAAVERAVITDAEPAQYAAVIDRPGVPIGLMLSAEGGEIAAETVLDPCQAIDLAGELIAAALPRLGRASR